MKKTSLTLLITSILTLSLFTACTNILNNNNRTGIIRFASGDNSRASTSNGVEQLTNLILTGTYKGETSELGHWNTFSDAVTAEIEIPIGTWTFNLQATGFLKKYTGTITNKNINAGNNILSFLMEEKIIETTVDKLAQLYTDLAASNKTGTEQTCKLKIKEPVETKEQWLKIIEALKTVQNNTYVSLEADIRNFSVGETQLEEENKAKAIKEFIFLNGTNTQLKMNAYFLRYTVSPKNLDSVVFKGDNMTIGSSLFNGFKLNDVTITGNNTIVETNSFDFIEGHLKSSGNNCIFNTPFQCEYSKIKTIEIGGNNTKFNSDHTFMGCPELTEVILKEGITEIPESTFAYCKKLNKVILPKSLQSIGSSAFSDCSPSLKVTFASPDNWYYEKFSYQEKEYIHADVKYFNNHLSSKWIKTSYSTPLQKDINYVLNGQSVKTLPKQTTYSKEIGLPLPTPEDLSLPAATEGTTLELKWYKTPDCNSNLIKSISPSDCEGTEPLTIYGTYTYKTTTDKIETVYNSFTKPGTYSITLNDKISTPEQWSIVKTALSTLRGSETPDNTEDDIYVALSVNFDSDFNYAKATKASDPADKDSPITPLALKEVIILPETTRVGDFVFNKCTNLTKLTLPPITDFGKQTFDKCENLTYIDYKGTLEQWCSFDHYTPRVHPQAYQNKVQDYTLIIDGKEITTNVNLPSTVKNYGIGIFKNCSKLKTVNIPEGTTGLGKHMFANCRNLNNVTIPASITVIPEEIFYQCNSLDNLIFEDDKNIERIDSCALSSTGFSKFKFPEKIKTIQSGILKNCDKLAEVELPAGATAINGEAFLNCTNLTKLKLPENVTKIGKSFIKGSGITEIEFPKSLTDNPASWTYNITKSSKFEAENGKLSPTIIGNLDNFTSEDNKFSEAELNIIKP